MVNCCAEGLLVSSQAKFSSPLQYKRCVIRSTASLVYGTLCTLTAASSGAGTPSRNSHQPRAKHRKNAQPWFLQQFNERHKALTIGRPPVVQQESGKPQAALSIFIGEPSDGRLWLCTDFQCFVTTSTCVPHM